MTSPQFLKRMDQLQAYITRNDAFFATILLNRETKYTEDIPVAAVDDNHFYFNPYTFGLEFTMAEQLFIYYHEIMHVALMTGYYARGRDHETFSRASDYLINDYVYKDKCLLKSGEEHRFVKMPADALFDGELVKRGKTQVGIYNLLMEGYEEQPGTPFDFVYPSQNPALKSQTKVLIHRAIQTARLTTGMSDALKRLTDNAITEPVRWETEFQNFITKNQNTIRSWRRPNRRLMCHGMFAPSRLHDAGPVVAVGIDCSGSVFDIELGAFRAQLEIMHTEIRPQKLIIIYFDHELCRVDVLGPDDSLRFQPIGDRGTDFGVVFNWLDKNMDQHNPDCLVMLTDMGDSNYTPDPRIPVLWLSTTGADHEVPFGKVIPLEIDQNK